MTKLTKQERAVVKKAYGWGILDKDGQPYWSESCVCEHREPMEEEARMLNDIGASMEFFARRPFRVVRLYFTRLARSRRGKGEKG